jgi:hypothetical protein
MLGALSDAKNLKVPIGSTIIYLRRAPGPRKKRTKGLKRAKAGRQVPGGILKLKMPFRKDGPAFPDLGTYWSHTRETDIR